MNFIWQQHDIRSSRRRRLVLRALGVVSLISLACQAIAQDSEAIVDVEVETEASKPALPAYESLPERPAAETLPKPLLGGPHHSVEKEAPAYLFAYTYGIDSDYGVFSAHGRDAFFQRINEINAISALREMKTTKTFTDATAKAAMTPVDAAKDLVTKPAKTTTGVFKGLFRAGKRVTEGVAEGVVGAVTGNKEEKGEFESGIAEDMLGYSRLKRELAIKLGVDPYSRNDTLQAELDEVTRTAFAGDLGIGVLFAVIPGGVVGSVIRMSGPSDDLQALIVDKSASDLESFNRKKMKKMGVSADVIEEFQENQTGFLPSHRAYIVDAATRLGEASGKQTLFRLAGQTRDELDAAWVQKTVEMLAVLHINEGPLVEIVDGNGLIGGITDDNRLVVPIAAEYFAWTPLAHRIADAVAGYESPERPIDQRIVQFGGEITPLVREAFEAMGLVVQAQ